MSFKLDNMSNLIIYGAGLRGYECYKYLTRMHYNIRYIIDKEPSKVINKYDCSVVCLDDIDASIMGESIIIICLQNGMIHDSVASDLYKKGAKQIMFLPTCKKYNYEYEMRNCYQKLLEEDWDVVMEIPNYEEMMVDDSRKSIIRDDGTMVTCWTTMEYIFSLYKSCSTEYELYFNKHISCLKPYMVLYDYIQGGDVYPNEYLRIFRGDDKVAQQKLLEDRVRLWGTYEEKMNMDSLYFCSAAPTAEWDAESKCFRIIDGHHRAAYLYYKNWYEIPVRVSKETYDKYINYHRIQAWGGAEREIRVAWYKICVELLRWVIANNISFNYVHEQEETKGYITSWLIRNGIYIDAEQSKVSDNHPLYVCLCVDDQLCELVKRCKTGWIIANESIESMCNLKKCLKLYSGFIGDMRVVINLYEV